jgi:D-alanyl-D-alanine carboxypeptidase
MCGSHRKRPATEDEDEVIGANNNPDSPYGVFLSSLNPPKAKSAAALLQDAKLGEPVLVYTGTKPPAPGSLAAGDAKKKTAVAKPPAAKDAPKDTGKDTGKDAAKNGTATAAAPSGEATKPKPKPKPKAPATTDTSKDGASAAAGDGTAAKPKPKPAPKDAGKDAATPTAAAGAAADGATPKPKPKKPAPKPAATDITSPAQQTSQQAR